jgi:hypothetical protein
MLGRRQSWPAIMVLGVSLVVLAIALKGGQGDMPVEPQWLMGAAAGLLVILALAMGGLSWRWPATLAVMAAGQLLLALMMGWGFSAGEGYPRDPYAALLHGLWDYLPGLVLQVGFAGALGAVAAAWFTRDRPEADHAPAPGDLDVAALPDLGSADGPEAAVQMACQQPGVGAALIAQEGTALAAGAWQRDPRAAADRVLAVARLTGAGLNTFTCGEALLLVHWEGGHCVALLVAATLPADLAHGLLRDLWGWEMVAEEAEQ